jgi:hypothetical protein
MVFRHYCKEQYKKGSTPEKHYSLSDITRKEIISAPEAIEI